jgi:hypothetical protein
MFNSLLLAIIFVAFILYTILNTNLDPDRAPSTCGERLRWGLGRFRIMLAIGLILLFCFMVGDMQTKMLLHVSAMGRSDWEYELIGVLVPLVLGKLVLTVLRIQKWAQGSLPLTTALMLSFLGNSFASLAARRFVFERLKGTQLVLACSLMALIEMLASGSALSLRLITADPPDERDRRLLHYCDSAPVRAAVGGE